MAIFNNDCIDSADWVERITGHRPSKNVISFKELSVISSDHEKNGGDDGLPNHWDYPLSETQMLATDEDKNEQEYVLVRFKHPNCSRKYEYRWCEV